MRKLLKNNGVQAFIASVICIILGIFIGYIALLCINPAGAGEGILAIIKCYFKFGSSKMILKNMGSTMVKTAPLVMCSLSVLFGYKVGLFNIGVAGQYVVGSCASLYAAIILGWSWIPCILFAAIVGAIWGTIPGILKAYCNVNEVISGIMLNWIGLYLTNMILAGAKDASSAYTYTLKAKGQDAILPQVGLDNLFGGNKYVSIALPLTVIIAIIIWVLLDKTKFGYELKATGNNKNAAKYAGMAEKRNIIVTLAISGMLAGVAGSFLYLTDIMQWQVTVSSVPGMGFNGIAAAFLGGLNPIGTIFASFFIQHITDGGGYLDKGVYFSQISDLIAAIIIYLCGFVGFIKLVMNKALAKKEGGDK